MDNSVRQGRPHRISLLKRPPTELSSPTTDKHEKTIRHTAFAPPARRLRWKEKLRA